MGDPTPPRDWATVAMSAVARDYYERTFLPSYERLARTVEAIPLAVLVWGPGPSSGGDLYHKRLQIRAQLREAGVAAVFSEEIDQAMPEVVGSAKARELLQAVTADLIVVIQGSAGSIAEVHDMSAFPRDIGSKMLIFVDKRAMTGYSFSGALCELRDLYGNVEVYTYPDDIVQCHLSGAVHRKVTVLRHAKWRSTLR